MTSATTAEITHRPLGKYGQLEVDAFCAGCGYNLHGQDVSMDERLAFLVCRCPECGRFHPAGVGTSANSVWTSRMASIVLVLWMCIVLATAALVTLAMGGLQAAYINTFCWYQADSKTQNFGGQWHYTLDPPSSADPMTIPGWGTATILIAVSAVVGFLVGTLLVSFLWHWPRRRYGMAVILPMIGATFATWLFLDQREYQYVVKWCISHVWMIAGVQAMGMLLAVRFGRPLARLIVRTIVPPKPRQLLTFLWRVDGTTLPS